MLAEKYDCRIVGPTDQGQRATNIEQDGQENSQAAACQDILVWDEIGWVNL